MYSVLYSCKGWAKITNNIIPPQLKFECARLSTSYLRTERCYIMKIDWITVVCTLAVVAMGVLAFFFEYGIGVGKDTKENDSDHEKDEKVQVEEEEK